MQLAVEQAVEPADWDEIEAAFRVHAFGVFYKRTFRDERDPLKRFVKALLASAEPIRDRQAVIEWHRKRVRRKPCRKPGDNGDT